MERKRKTFLLLFSIAILLLIPTIILGIKYLNLNGKDIGTPTTDDSPTNLTSYPIVDTAQGKCFDNTSEIECTSDTTPFPGQDANYNYLTPSYNDNNDGTISDLNTRLIWQRSADINNDGVIDINDKKNQNDAQDYCSELSLAGYTDWRLPDIKTLYSLMNFSGTDTVGTTDKKAIPFIDTTYFDFAYGDTNAGERQIDSQWASSSIYVSTVMNNQKAMFGLNLADGRIKGYPVDKLFYIKCVRGNEEYAKNEFVDNGDKTITDKATKLKWQKEDSKDAITWEGALLACENLDQGGYNDWRLPNAKELQSLVDYSRSPDTTNSPAINPIFISTEITNERNQKDWGFYWTSTTHERSDGNGSEAVYISFGRAMGKMNGQWLDVHGAGAQRSDPKQGNPADYPNGQGPQGDARRIYNYYRCVRGVSYGTFIY